MPSRLWWRIGTRYAMWSGHDAHGNGLMLPQSAVTTTPKPSGFPAGPPRKVVGAVRHFREHDTSDPWVPRAREREGETSAEEEPVRGPANAVAEKPVGAVEDLGRAASR